MKSIWGFVSNIVGTNVLDAIHGIVGEIALRSDGKIALVLVMANT